MPSHPTFWISVLILSSHLGLSLPSSPFPSDCPIKTCSQIPSPPCSAHIILYLITPITSGDKYQSWSYSLRCLLQSRVILSLLGPKYFPQQPQCEGPSDVSFPTRVYPPIKNAIIMYVSGMCNFRLTIPINTNNTPNYQSTNETHYTQQNTTIITHRGSQLSILI